MDFFLSLDWATLAKIVMLDIVLGGDNAVVIAMACAGVPLAYRTRAIVGGTAAAILLRVAVLLAASYIIAIPLVKVAAGLTLLWVGYSLLTSNDEVSSIDPKSKVWDAIKAIAIADLVMSVDNVFAVTGAAQSAGTHSAAYAIAGVAISIPIIVFGASLISKVIDKFPIITWIGGGLLGWVAIEMAMSDKTLQLLYTSKGSWEHYLCGSLLVVILAFLENTRQKKIRQLTGTL